MATSPSPPPNLALSISEGTLHTDDHIPLYTKTWTNNPESLTARLVFVHGFSDHINCYGTLFPSLAHRGIKVYAYDQRGWGQNVRSPRDRGNTGNTTRILGDLTCMLESVLAREEESHIPLFLMGHSMGGGEVLWYAANGPREIRARIRGILCESPFIALPRNSRPWKSTVLLGKWASRVLPQRQMVSKLDTSKMCRDVEVCREWDEDPLCHDTGTLECLTAMLDRAGDLEEGRAVVKEGEGEGGKTRVWIGFGTGDQVVSYEACEKWFRRLQVEDKELKAYEGWYHKLHSEPGDDKRTFAHDVAQWILDRSGPLDNAVKPRL